MSENINDAIPTMGYAITAYKRSGGDPKSKYWPEYQKALLHFSSIHGKDAANQLQDIVIQTAGNKGDLNDELAKFSKRAIDTKQSINPVIKNMLAMAYDGQKPLEKFQYAFDLPDKPDIAGEPTTLPDKLAQLFKK